jgi:hypothetical protein
MLEGTVAMYSTPNDVFCEVIEPMPTVRRSADEYKALVETAARGLANSKIANLLPARPLNWVVVDDYGMGALQLWPAL